MGTSKHRKGQKQKAANRTNKANASRKGQEIKAKKKFEEDMIKYQEEVEQHRKAEISRIANSKTLVVDLDVTAAAAMNAPKESYIAGLAENFKNKNGITTTGMLLEDIYSSKQ